MSAATFRAFSVHRHLPTCNSRGHTRPRPMQHLAAAAKTVIVCTNSGCKKKGGAAALKWFQELAPEEVEVVQQNCLDECPMGPNCGVPRADDAEIITVINKVKTREDVVAVLRSMGVQPVEA